MQLLLQTLMKIKLLSFFFSLVIVCGACDKSAPKIRLLNSDSVVVAFGDSLTAGTGAGKDKSYPAVLSDIIGCTVVNAGIPGEVTQDGLQRLPAVLHRYNPDLVILCHGGNDILRRYNESTTISNLNRMIDLTRKNGADVILVGVPKPGLRIKTADLYNRIADQHKIPYDSESIAKILTKPSQKSDTIHPNAKGYKILAAALADLIMKSQSK